MKNFLKHPETSGGGIFSWFYISWGINYIRYYRSGCGIDNAIFDSELPEITIWGGGKKSGIRNRTGGNKINGRRGCK